MPPIAGEQVQWITCCRSINWAGNATHSKLRAIGCGLYLSLLKRARLVRDHSRFYAETRSQQRQFQFPDLPRPSLPVRDECADRVGDCQ